MFRRLKRRLILMNVGITGVVILVVFTIIYIVSIQAASRRSHMPEIVSIYPNEMQRMITFTVQEEKGAAAQDLLTMLIVSGVSVELLVFLISSFLAEQAIKPVREAYEAQKVFIANASHEIKTPLAAISANLEAADIRGNHWIDNAAAETAKLATLNSELLTLARTDLMTDDVAKKEVDLAAVANRLIASFEPRMRKINLTKEMNINNKVKLNEKDFEQVLSILMDNAVKYGDKKVKVVLTENKLIVENDGKKIPAEKLTHIFDRFYQVDKTSEGVGLGLSIAKAVAERNGWILSAKSGAMTEFTLDF